MFIPTFLFGIILFYFPHLTSIVELKDKIELVSTIFGLTALLPSLLVFILFKKKVISSMTLFKREDRYIPQLFSCFSYLGITAFLLYKYGLHNGLTLTLIANSISLIIITIVNHYWKISTHSSGAAGLLSASTVLYLKGPSELFFNTYLIISVVSVTVCFARIYLKAHTPMQVLAGCVLGGTIGFLVFQIQF